MLLLLFVLFVNAVTPCAQVGSHLPTLPWASPPRAVRTISVLTLWDRLALPSLALPAWDRHTTLPLMLVLNLGCSEWLAGWESLPPGEGEGGSLGGQRRAGNAWTAAGQPEPLLSGNSCFSPIPGSHPQPPKRWPLFTVRTRSLCLRFLKYKL